MSFWVLKFLFVLSTAQAMPQWMQTSHTILLPAQVSEALSATQRFPLFWWNFLVLEVPSQGWDDLDSLCSDLEKNTHSLTLKMACGERLEEFQDIVAEWASDQALREPPPSPAQFRSSLQESVSLLSLPGGHALLSLLRVDPLSSYKQLQSRTRERVQLGLGRRNGFFFDAETNRVVIPIQLRFPPDDIEQTKLFMAAVDATLSQHGIKSHDLIGPQASTAANESRIRSDVKIISRLGPLLLLLQVAAALALRRWRLLLLVPPVLLSTGLATAVTILMFGSIHGLTLAFGPGIIGLVMDHGLHSCLNTQWKGAWRANWYGLLTTIVALALMLFSAIPFLRQLMAFSITGLFFGFATYWILHKKFPKAFAVEPILFSPKPRRWQFVVTVLLSAVFVLSGFWLRPNFSMQQMNYQTKEDANITRWFFTHLKVRSPLLQIFGQAGQSPLAEAEAQQAFASEHQISLENIALYLPNASQQATHLAAWKALCQEPLGGSVQTLFAPFFKSLCQQKKVEDLADGPRRYLSDFYSRGEWLSLWLAKTPGEVQMVKTFRPDARSLPEIVEMFQTLLEHETVWMAPGSIVLAMLLLWFYYRKTTLVLLSMVPFVLGMGTFASAALLFHFDISFVSLIAIVMIFGLSLDYGIFATNLYTGQSGLNSDGVWTSVLLAATVTFLGFLPLVFCQHPVLVQLGQALVFGTAGTIFGSVWGIPCLHAALARKKS